MSLRISTVDSLKCFEMIFMTLATIFEGEITVEIFMVVVMLIEFQESNLSRKMLNHQELNLFYFNSDLAPRLIEKVFSQ